MQGFVSYTHAFRILQKAELLVEVAVRINGTSPNWRETFCFSTSAEATGHTIVDVTRVYKHVGEHQLVAETESGQTAEFQLAADYTFIAGRQDFWPCA